MRKVAILRPEPGASATLERALDLGLDAFALPLFEVIALDWEAPQANAFDGLLLTSANAVRHGGDALQTLRGLPVYAVGGATAAEARSAGFDVAATGDTGVAQLLGSIDPALSLFHPCGRHWTKVKAAQTITAITVYESRAIVDVDPGPLEGSIVLAHSIRAVQRLAELIADRSTIIVAAISPACAAAAGPGWAGVETANAPNDDALLALAARLCKNGGQE